MFLKNIYIFSFHEFLIVNTIFFIHISGIYFQNWSYVCVYNTYNGCVLCNMFVSIWRPICVLLILSSSSFSFFFFNVTYELCSLKSNSYATYSEQSYHPFLWSFRFIHWNEIFLYQFILQAVSGMMLRLIYISHNKYI